MGLLKVPYLLFIYSLFNTCVYCLSSAAQNPNSYLRLRELAKSRPQETAVPPTYSSQSKTIVQTQTPQLNTEIYQDENIHPFTSEMYDNLKFVIAKLTSRVKGTSPPLNQNDILQFQKSVKEIIADAKGLKNVVISHPKEDTVLESRSINENQKSSKPDDAFDPLLKGTSSWNVPGMAFMDTNEYYSAINKRNREIQEFRKSQPDYERPGEITDNYLASLSRKK